MNEETTLDEFVEDERETHDETQELFGLGRIPTEWMIKPLSESAEIIPGNSPPSSTYNGDGNGLPFFQGNSNFGHFHPEVDTWCSEPRKEAQPNDVLISIRAPVGDLNIANTRSCIGRGLAAIRPKSLNGLYLHYNLGKRKIWLSRLATGSTFKAINKSDLQLLDIPVPPLSEQRKIATVLYTVDQAIEKTEEVVKQANRLKRACTHEFYSQGYYDHQEWQQVDMQDAYVMTRTDELPAMWDIEKSGNISEVKTGHTPSTSVDEYWDGDISWVDIHDLTQLEGTVIHTTDDSITEEGLNNSGAKLLPEGTLVLCRTGAIGETAILGKEMATDQDQVTFECDESRVLPRYLMYLFEYATPQLERLSAGSTHNKVQLHFFSDLEIPLPEIDEQRKIVEILESVNDVSQANKKQLDNLKQIKRGLMQDLLSGTVRTTDTNIEVPEEITRYG
jgi:type I restriction enzyme S subunit